MGAPMSRSRRLFASAVAVLALTGRVALAAEGDEAAPGTAPEPASTAAPVPLPAPEPSPGTRDPVAGFAGERAFLRSPGNEVVLLPALRLEVGSAFFPRSQPQSGFTLRRARVELAGWMGSQFYFDLAGDFATGAEPLAPNGTAPTDAYAAFAPAGDLVIVQAGRFDVPFSFENRTLEGYAPFLERSLVGRAIGAPFRKDVGVMVQGTDDARTFHYSVGVFNGDGPGLRNADDQVDFIGRVVAAPLARSSFDSLRAISLGGSAWYGQRAGAQPFVTQATPGGFVVFDPAWTSGGNTPFALRQNGSLLAFGGELNLPIGNLFGVRGEFFFKKQNLTEDSVGATGASLMTLGRAKLQALGGYGEAYVWLLGDDRLLPRPGLELPVRLGRVVEATPQQGVTFAVRGEMLKEDLTSTQTILGDPNLATTRVLAGSGAVTYWYGRRVRASFIYGLTALKGTTENVKDSVANNGAYEHEVMVVVAMAL
jgi:Phosphate-selective porin O and P